MGGQMTCDPLGPLNNQMLNHKCHTERLVLPVQRHFSFATSGTKVSFSKEIRYSEWKRFKCMFMYVQYGIQIERLLYVWKSMKIDEQHP